MTGPKICPQCGGTYDAAQRFCPRDGAALRGQTGGGTLVGEVIADRYHVLRRLGEGGMGEVYLAEHVRMGRPSAVKVMRAGSVDDPDAVSRFNREAANASRINHPNVAAIYDFGETADGLIYLAMEYVAGIPLRALLDREGALPPARAVAIASQVADALGAAHVLGIVHRDLKPDNVMVGRSPDGSDLIKVVDFGIAKASGAEGQQVTRTGLIVGTPEYMSPEQLAGDPSDGRSDVYALGLITYAMLTGLLPFPSETVQDTLVLRLTTPPLRLAQLRPDVSWPAPVQRVLDGALARRPADRYAQAADFARELAEAFGLIAAGAPLTSRAGTLAAAAEAPTQVLDLNGLTALAGAETRAIAIDGVPSTRVASGEGPGTRDQGPGAAAPSMTRARRTRRAAVALATAVVAIGGIAAWHRQTPRADAASSAPPAAADSVTRFAAPVHADSAAALASNDATPPAATSPAPAPAPEVTPAATRPAPSAPRVEERSATYAARNDNAAIEASPMTTSAVSAAERVVAEAGLDAAALAAALRQVRTARSSVVPTSDEALVLSVAHGLLLGMSDSAWTRDACTELRAAARDRRTPTVVPEGLLFPLRLMLEDTLACG